MAAVRVVERVIEADVAPRSDQWPALLNALATQLDRGRVYRRDVAAAGEALDRALAAYRRAVR